ncbi:hypothetical protein SAMN05446935_7995 [Burkholderia sp. YR290]|nr:hypothetical protein SAMN05446935_7995 [Burkholderia sp. YR290]
MSSQSYAPYRGYDITVIVTPARLRALGGIYRRFRVSWTVSLRSSPAQEVASLPEQFDFLTEQEAFRYGENRAHTFIDSMLCAPSQRWSGSGSSERADAAPTV